MYRRLRGVNNRMVIIFTVGRPNQDFGFPVFVVGLILFLIAVAAVAFGIVIAAIHDSGDFKEKVDRNVTATVTPTNTTAVVTPPPPFITVIPLPTATASATVTSSPSATLTTNVTATPTAVTATTTETQTAAVSPSPETTPSVSPTVTVVAATATPTASVSQTPSPSPRPPSCNENPFTGFTNLARIQLSNEIPSIAGGAFANNTLIQPLDIWSASQGIPFFTNEWWQNLVLNSTADTSAQTMFTRPAYALPYFAVAASAGLQVSYPVSGFSSLRWAPWVCVGPPINNNSSNEDTVCPVYSEDSPPDCAVECADRIAGGGSATINTPHYWAWKPFAAGWNTVNNFTVELGIVNDTGLLRREVPGIRDFFTFDMSWNLQPAENESESDREMSTILLRGSPYVTMGYTNSTPIIKGIIGLYNSSICCAFQAVRKLRNGSLYELDFEHTWNEGAQNQTWALYANPAINLTVVNNNSSSLTEGALRADGNYTGILRLALLRSGSEDQSVADIRRSVLDNYVMDIVRQTFVFTNISSADTDVANIGYLWATNTQQPPLMCNLPQHRTDFDSSRVNSTELIYESLWGEMQCVVGCSWLMREPLYNFDYFAPCQLDPVLANLSASFLNSTIQPVFNGSSGQQTAPGVFQDVDGSEELYQYGKRLTKIASLLLAAEQTGAWDVFATPLINQPSNLPDLPLPALQSLIDFVLNGTAADTFCTTNDSSSLMEIQQQNIQNELHPCNADEEELMKVMPALAEVIQSLSHCVPLSQWALMTSSSSSSFNTEALFSQQAMRELGQCNNSGGFSDCVTVNCTPGNPNLLYDITWGGLISNLSLNDPATLEGAHFGNAIYNDHHLWYGYFVYALAVAGRYDPDWLAARLNATYDLMRDYANPNTNDPFFPFFRHKDWFTYNSWGLGLVSSDVGRSQQSASEAVHAYYAMQLIGLALNNSNLANLGRILVATEARIASTVYRPSASPFLGLPAFITNQTLYGTLSELAVSQGSYYGSSLETTQGIQFLPWTPATALLYNNSADFIRQNDQFLSALMAVEQPLGFPLFPADYLRVSVGNYSLFEPNVEWVSHLYQTSGVVDTAFAVAALTNASIIDWNSSSVRTTTANNGNTLPVALIWLGTRPDPMTGQCTPAPLPPPALMIPGALFLRGLSVGELSLEIGSTPGNKSRLIIPKGDSNTSIEAPPQNESLMVAWNSVQPLTGSSSDTENPIGEILLWIQLVATGNATLRVRTNYDFDGDSEPDFWNDCDFTIVKSAGLQRLWSEDTSNFLGCCSSDPELGCSDTPPSTASNSINGGSVGIQLWIKSSAMNTSNELFIFSDSSAAYGSYSYITTYFGESLHAV